MRSARSCARGLCPDVLRSVLAEHELLVGEAILAELRNALTSRLKLPADHLRAIDAVFAPFQVIPKPSGPSPLPIRDPADRWILATAVAGKADVLVTGDHDLPAIQADSPVRILEPRAFWDLLRSGRSG